MICFSRCAKFMLPVLFSVLFTCPVAAVPSAAAPAPGTYVNDFAGVMDAQTIGSLNAVLADLDAKAKAQVAVLAVKSLGGADIETYAAETYKKWGIGDKKTSRGVLLLVAVDDHKSRIEVGYGLEGILTDGLTGSIQDKYLIPYFKAGDYSTGIARGSLAIASVIAGNSGVTLSGKFAESGQGNAAPMSPGQKILSFIFIAFLIILFIRHPFLAFFFLNTMTRSSGGFGGGGFGGFGGGSSGGGGSSRSW